MIDIRRGVSLVALCACLAPASGHAQSMEDLVQRLDRLERENAELRRDIEILKGARTPGEAIATASAEPAPAPEAPPTPAAQAYAAPAARGNGGAGVIRFSSAYSYAMLDPTIATSRKQRVILEAKRSGAIETGAVYLGGAVTGLVDYQDSNRDSKFGYLMRHPTSANQIGKTASEAVLHSAQLSFTATPSPWITAYAEVLYDPEQSFGSGAITALARNQLQLRKGYVLFGDLERSPVYASVGKMEAPFGWTETVNPFTASTVWHGFGGLSWGALVGYAQGGLNVSLEAVQGGAQFRALNTPVRGTAVPSRLNNYVVDANYTFDLGGPQRSLLAGASYVRGTAYCQAFPVAHFGACPDNNPAYAVYGQFDWDRLTLMGEFVETTRAWPATFNPNPPLNVYPAHKTGAWDLGGKYVAEVAGMDLHLSADFSRFIAGPEGSPWRRQDQIVFGLAAFPAPSVKLFSEVVLVEGFVPLNFISGGNLAPGETWSEQDARSTVLLAGANVAF